VFIRNWYQFFYLVINDLFGNMQFGLTIIGSVMIHTIYSYVTEQVVYSTLEVTMQYSMKSFT